MANLFVYGLKESGFVRAIGADQLVDDSYYQKGADVWVLWSTIYHDCFVDKDGGKDEPESTTKAPTTKEPTTKEPTTKEPTTKAPTTKAPTTKATTQATTQPTTKESTTKESTTRETTEATTVDSSSES